MIAASSSSLGRSRMKVVAPIMVNGRVKNQVGNDQTEQIVAQSPARISSNMPDSTATCGNIDTPSTVSSSPRPSKLHPSQRERRRHPRRKRQGDHGKDTSTELKMLWAKGCSNTAMVVPVPAHGK